MIFLSIAIPLLLVVAFIVSGVGFRLDRSLWYGTSSTVIHVLLGGWMVFVAFAFPLQNADAPDAINPITLALLVLAWNLVHWALDLRKSFREREEETFRRLEREAREAREMEAHREAADLRRREMERLYGIKESDG